MAALKVTYPEGAVILRAGSEYEIKWESIGSTHNRVKIFLYESTGHTLIETITANTLNSGSFFWKIPENRTARTDYYIKIKTTNDLFIDNGSDFEIKDRFTISEFANLIDFKKSILFEIKPGFEIPLIGWRTESGYGSGDSGGTKVFVLDNYLINNEFHEIVDIEESGETLTRVFNIADCEGNNGSFFHDLESRRLYVNIISGGSPETSGVFLMGYTILGFCNAQEKDNHIVFTPTECTLPIYYKPFLETSSIPPISQKVGEFYTAAVTIQFGSIKLINNGWWWDNKEYYNWHNKNGMVKIGEIGNQYDEYVTIYPCRIRTPSFKDKNIVFNAKDQRTGILKDIPSDKFSLDDYPNMDPDLVDEPIPILFGIKSNITSICIDTTSFKYKISKTIFTNSYPIQSIDTIYRQGVALVETYDYTADLTNGEFTLVDDPGDALITCDVHGLKCQYDFSDGSATGVFTENVADILFFILRELNNIPINLIDLDSFSGLQSIRTQRLGWYLDTQTRTLEFIRMLQRSAIFHFIPSITGLFLVRYYDRATPIGIPYFRNEDYFRNSFELIEDTESAFKEVVILYDKDPTLDKWEVATRKELETGYKHKEETTLTLETALVNGTEALNLAIFYREIIKDPGNKLRATVSANALESIPGDKAKFFRSVRDDRGETITILDDEVYLLLEVRKDIGKATVSILGLEDTQAGGTGEHADIAHQDEHSDGHLDQYGDVAHEDSEHGDDHGDVAHQDDHTDIPYSDHTDLYNDDHTDHTDDFHLNIHSDNYLDHSDGPYTDHTDNIPHTDSHSDEAHLDSHTDEHQDEYSDIHEDIPHTDSEI